jgi:hypothetical protein
MLLFACCAATAKCTSLTVKIASPLLLQVGQTLLHWQCLKGHAELAQLLLDRGAKVDAADEARRSCWLACALPAPRHHIRVLGVLGVGGWKRGECG